jgi:hypothetical protein
VLDANISISPAGDEAARLTVAGSYRPPLGRLGAGLDRAIMHRVATATMRCLLQSVAEALVSPGPGRAPPLKARAMAGNLPQSRGCPDGGAVRRRGPDRTGEGGAGGPGRVVA